MDSRVTLTDVQILWVAHPIRFHLVNRECRNDTLEMMLIVE